jgi:prepilin-type N-terminal cleavage/methylation domain-containing protein
MMSIQSRNAAGEHQREEQEMQEEGKREQGFTLIELLIAIVVVGILTAVAIVGIAGLTNKGNASACSSTIDAARAASAVFYANNNGKYPQDFTPDLTGGTPALLDLHGVTVAANTLTGNGWHIDGTFNATSEPTFKGTVNASNSDCEAGTGP